MNVWVAISLIVLVTVLFALVAILWSEHRKAARHRKKLEDRVNAIVVRVDGMAKKTKGRVKT